MEERIGRGRAVGKVILMGEHAVVYGEPAISIPFLAARTDVKIRESRGDILINCDFYRGYLKDAGENLLGIRSLIERLLEDLGEDCKNLSIDIETSIPVERGMGSSAAVAVAVTRGLYDYFDRELDDESLLAYADISEKIVHGNPSGLDAATIVGETSLYYIKGEDFRPFDLSLDAYLVVADSGQIGKTREAVEGVRLLIEQDRANKDLIENLGSLTDRARLAMEENRPEELGRLMLKAQRDLASLEVSNERLETLVARAMEEGSLGAKLTGGGRGGSMIALAKTREDGERIALALEEAGARASWISYLGGGLDGEKS